MTVGKFKVANQRLFGEATDKRVQWRKYTVRPGFPADAPSNLLWVREKTTEDLGDFRLRLGLVPPKDKAPKIAVTFQGEGGTDGLSGWTLLVHPEDGGKVAARLERYEVLAYQTVPLPVPEAQRSAEEVSLVLTYEDRRLTVALGEVVLLRAVSIDPIPGRHRVGLATWGPEPAITSFELER